MGYGSSKLFYNRCGLGVDLWVNDWISTHVHELLFVVGAIDKIAICFDGGSRVYPDFR